MKTIKGLYVTVFILLTIQGFSQNKKDVVFMKINQNYQLLRTDSYIRISYPDGTTKVIELAKAGYRIDDPEEDANTKLIQKAINSVTDTGYEVVSSSITGDYNCKWTIIIFSRKED